MSKFYRGQIVKCVEDGRDYNNYNVTVGKTYVISAVDNHNGSDYLKILGDDDRGIVLLNSMFVPAVTDTADQSSPRSVQEKP